MVSQALRTASGQSCGACVRSSLRLLHKAAIWCCCCCGGGLLKDCAVAASSAAAAKDACEQRRCSTRAHERDKEVTSFKSCKHWEALLTAKSRNQKVRAVGSAAGSKSIAHEVVCLQQFPNGLTLLMFVTGTIVRLLTASAETVGTGPLDVSDAQACTMLPLRRSACIVDSNQVVTPDECSCEDIVVSFAICTCTLGGMGERVRIRGAAARHELRNMHTDAR